MHAPNPHRETLKQKVMGGPVLHIPNIQDEAGIEGLKAIERYKLRSLTVLDKHDVSILPSNVEAETQEMLRLYEDLHIPHIAPENVLFMDPSNGDRLSQTILKNRKEVARFLKCHPRVQRLVPFIHSPDSDQIASIFNLKTEMSSESSEKVNDKGLSQRELAAEGVDTPVGRVVHSLAEALDFCSELREAGFQEVMFKIIRSASGQGVFQISFDQVPAHIETYADEVRLRGVLLDGYIPDKNASPNIQYYVSDSPEQDYFISCSDQILENGVHLGNVNDTDLYYNNARARENVRKTRDWARKQGYRGIVGIDLYITSEGRPYYMETNARFNGSTPGALLADKLHETTVHIPWGVQNNIAVSKGTTVNDFLAALERDKLLYDPETRMGVLPTNTSAIQSHNKAMVAIFARTSGQVQEILAMLDGFKPKDTA